MSYDPEISLLGIYPEKTLIQKDICTPYIAALFTTAKVWKQPKVSINRGTDKNVVHTHGGILLSYKKRSNMDGSIDYDAKWSQTNIIWYHLYVEYIYVYIWTYLQNNNRFTDIENKHSH